MRLEVGVEQLAEKLGRPEGRKVGGYSQGSGACVETECAGTLAKEDYITVRANEQGLAKYCGACFLVLDLRQLGCIHSKIKPSTLPLRFHWHRRPPAEVQALL